MEIIIDPRLKYNYASWYLLGLEKVVGKNNIHFDIAPFITLPYNDRHDYNSGFAFVCLHGMDERKCFIDTEDVAKIFEDRYAWCDIYGMVNPTKDQVENYPKLLPIGPEFGITLGTMAGTVIKCLRHFFKSRNYTNITLKDYLKDYLYTVIRRRALTEYEKQTEVRPNYVFHASTLWYNCFAATDTNKFRGDFLIACQKAGITIDGGLFYVEGEDVLTEMPNYPKYKEIYKDFIYEKRLSMDDYIRKTKQSVMVFNTPSVCECHGWKLAEYLCMGKAIISTPLSREMPAALIHGENIHFVSSDKELFEAVRLINQNEKYRKKLEDGARRYYEQWLSPEVVIRRVIMNDKRN